MTEPKAAQPSAPTPSPNEFFYLLNMMENAGQADEPSLEGYPAKRKAVLEFVEHLRKVNRELLEALEAAVEHGCACFSNKDDNWHSSKCFVPKAKAVIAKVKP